MFPFLHTVFLPGKVKKKKKKTAEVPKTELALGLLLSVILGYLIIIQCLAQEIDSTNIFSDLEKETKLL